jgi:hypothetical protein
MARTHYTHEYVGIRADNLKYERFQSDGTPVRETHGDTYMAVIGPFRTIRGAKYMAQYGKGNPHLQHVNDAEHYAAREREATLRLGNVASSRA